eukprot:gnl/TRDRNA2_/TRDRNA2_194378_c0_seq1.p2 gnl/TRDRNA2_/TRDRNA2_194378_c0~~gnl/TRDRNA2_/TRDRNA2_194378_c0_seq1.p2  ORF type:complete len:300 (-),score=55.20 gnl/TRDRNA2_/TRDRNA2_194378_c0_seq1:76-975(-)
MGGRHSGLRIWKDASWDTPALESFIVAFLLKDKAEAFQLREAFAKAKKKINTQIRKGFFGPYDVRERRGKNSGADRGRGHNPLELREGDTLLHILARRAKLRTAPPRGNVNPNAYMQWQEGKLQRYISMIRACLELGAVTSLRNCDGLTASAIAKRSLPDADLLKVAKEPTGEAAKELLQRLFPPDQTFTSFRRSISPRDGAPMPEGTLSTYTPSTQEETPTAGRSEDGDQEMGASISSPGDGRERGMTESSLGNFDDEVLECDEEEDPRPAFPARQLARRTGPGGSLSAGFAGRQSSV